MRPNVLLVVFDTARADAFEPYGAASGSTPSTADLARRGSAAPAAYSTANWTLPAHASLFSGLLPRTIGLGRESNPRALMASQSDRMLAEVLRRSGYATAAASANVWVTKRHGFAAGFDTFRSVSGPRRHHAGGGLLARIQWDLHALRAKIDDGLRAIDRIVRKWIEAGPQQPFFWFVNLMECHSPYLPPRPYNDLGPWQRILAGEDARTYQSRDGFVRVTLGDLDIAPASQRRMRHLYGRAVRSMDDWLGRTLERLDARGMLDDTLVIVTSDHGENLGDGHMLGHTLSLDDRLIRVPLVAAGPGAPSFSPGPISLTDVPRLVGEAAGLAEHPWEPNDRDGVVVAQTDGLRSLSPESADRFAKALGIPDHAVAAMASARSCATDGRFKLVRVDERETLYDLANDPLELSDALTRFPEEATRLRKALDAAESESSVAPAGSAGPVGPVEAAEEDKDLEERLRMLGYL
jgi:arylsulfatase A-like enzyme